MHYLRSDYELGAIRTDRGKITDKGNYVIDVTHPDFEDGVKGDGVADDTNAWLKAIAFALAGDTLYLPPGYTSRVRGMLTLTRPITLRGGGTILFDFPTTTSNALGGLFKVESDDVAFEDLVIDGGSLSGTITSVNRYAIIADPTGATRYSRLRVERCRFTNMVQKSGNIPDTSTVMHAIYARGVDDLLVRRCTVNNISGAGVTLIDTERAIIENNDFIKFGWSGVWPVCSNLHCIIRGNRFSGTTTANPCYFGAAIDVMGQTSDQVTPGEPDENCIIEGNQFIEGVYRYGAVVRVASGRGVTIRGNHFYKNDVDLWAPPVVSQHAAGAGPAGSHSDCIQLTVRDVTLNNGPHKNISIIGNIFTAKGAGWQNGIFCTGSSGGAGGNPNTTSCEGIIVEGNQFISTTSHYFQSAVQLHGSTAGFKNVVVRGNVISGTPYTTPNYVQATWAGLLAFSSNSGISVERIIVEGNVFERFSGAGSDNNACAIGVNVDVTLFVERDNVFKNFFRDVVVADSNAGVVVAREHTTSLSGTAGATSHLLRGTGITPSVGEFALRVSADEALTSQTALQNVTEQKVPIGPNEEWVVEFLLDLGADLATTGAKVAVAVPAGATANIVATLVPSTLAAANSAQRRTTTGGAALDFTAAAQVGVTDGLVRVVARVLNGATNGTIQLQFAQSTSSGTALTLRRGSYLRASRVA